MKKLLSGYFVLLIYFLGIGFISGSIVHFTLNPWRFGLIGLVGGVLFAVATYIQDFWGQEDKDTSRGHILYRVLIGVFLSIGLGMISGSIQHFDEITYEALWYIPIGTALSLISWWLQEKDSREGVSKWGWGGIVVGVTLLSVLISGYIQEKMFPDGPVGGHHAEGDAGDHHEDDGHGHKTVFTPRSGELMRDDFDNEEKLNIHMCLMGGGEGCDVITDPSNRETYADAIQEQCELMPGMEDCNTYFGTDIDGVDLGDTFDVSAKSSFAPLARQEIVELKDGDSYAMSLDNVRTTIGGKEVRMMGYNGSVPGPLIKIEQGAQITLSVTNNVGDIETTVHHHGLRGKDSEDGVPVSMGGFDVPIKKGETLSYQLEFPDPGIYRYHPHVREDFQQELGLYGNYLVTPKDENYWNEVDDEQVLMLDDIQLDDEGIAPFYTDVVTQTIMGRFGNHYLVNGREDYVLNLTQGETTRLYITNSANVRAFNVRIPGMRMKLVGGDLGAYEQESFIDSLLISPAERYVVEVSPQEAGEYVLEYQTPAFVESIAQVVVEESDLITSASDRFEELREVQQVVDDITAYEQYFDKPVDKTLRFDMTLNGKTKDDLSLKMTHPDDGSVARLGGLEYSLGKMEWLDEMFAMNVASTNESTKRQLIDEDTGKKSMMIDDWVFEQGDVVKVRLINDGEGLHPMQHPIHFHGQRFLVLSKDGVANDNMVWKDTVLTLPGEEMDILIDMSNPGKRMAHCHISEHNESGMMLNFRVEAEE